MVGVDPNEGFLNVASTLKSLVSNLLFDAIYFNEFLDVVLVNSIAFFLLSLAENRSQHFV